MNRQQIYYQTIKNDPIRNGERLKNHKRYYRKVIKQDPDRLEKRRYRSKIYARQRRLRQKGIEIMYLLFSGSDHYPDGGASDLVSTHKKLEDAQLAVKTLDNDWWHIYGIAEEKIVESSKDQ